MKRLAPYVGKHTHEALAAAAAAQNVSVCTPPGAFVAPVPRHAPAAVQAVPSAGYVPAQGAERLDVEGQSGEEEWRLAAVPRHAAPQGASGTAPARTTSTALVPATPRHLPKPAASAPASAAPSPSPASSEVETDATTAPPTDTTPSPSGSVAKNTALMSLATLGSRVTGLLRTWVMAFALGNTLITSAYTVANNMPNVIYDLVAGGMLGAAFIPVYLLQKERAGRSGGNLFANNILNLSIIVLGLMSLVAALLAPQVIATQTFTVANDAEVSTQAVFFFRIFAIQLLFYGVGGVVNGILNAERVYFLPALAPALNNVVVIAAFLAYIPLSKSAPTLANTVLALGTTAGVAVQAAIQIPALKRTGYQWRAIIDLRDPALIEAVKIAVPTALYIVGSLVAFSCRNAFSLWSGDEGPSVLAYAWIWFQLPYGVLAVSLSRTMFTEMSVDAAKNDRRALREHISSGINVTLLLIIPLAGLMGVFSESIMQLFQAGRFGGDDVAQVAHVLTLWVVALPFYSVWMYLYNVFAALRKFFRFAALNCAFVALQCGLYALLCPAGVLGLAGVPVADLVFYAAGCVATLVMLTRMVGSLGLCATLWRAVRIIAATAVGVGFAWALLHFLPLGTGGMLQGLLQLVLYGSVSLAVILALCAVLRLPEMEQLAHLGKRLAGKFIKR